jgi:hypothetical protein
MNFDGINVSYGKRQIDHSSTKYIYHQPYCSLADVPKSREACYAPSMPGEPV